MLSHDVSISSVSAHAVRLSAWILAAALFYVSVVIIYRLTFHPLAKYPGPFLAKITDWYSVYHAGKGDRHVEFWRVHEKYGKFVRYGPNSLSINSNTALKKIYGYDSNVQKAHFYSAFRATKASYSTHNTTDKAVHARKRRVLSHAFSDSAIKQMEKYIVKNIRSFGDSLGGQESEKGWTAAKNMADWCNYLTFDIMGDLCFGKAFDMVERPENRFAIDLVSSAGHRNLICGTLPDLHDWHADRIIFPKLAAKRLRYVKYSKAQAVERMKMGDDADRKDFFHYLLKAKDPETGAGFTMSELWGESNLLIIAGSDTTSTALASAFFYLVHNSVTLDKATAEVRAAFGNIEEIYAGQQLTGCVYIRAVLDEAMRMSPPVGGILPREVLAGGITIDEQFIPAGTNIGTPHYALHHNPDYYPSPFTFSPERWIADSSPSVTSESVALARSAFCAFSIGSRGCIGKGLAYTELMIGLARILFMYDMRLAPGTHTGEGSPDLEFGRHRPSEFQLIDTFTSTKDGPMIEFRRR